MPMIEVPAHPTFPAGHALQSHLISLCLKAAGRGGSQPEMLFHLSRRVAQNRVIAGLHYPVDNEAGVAAAEACFALLTETEQTEEQGTRVKKEKCPVFNRLLKAASAESNRELLDRPRDYASKS
jgi:acid phosphatase (class A)